MIRVYLFAYKAILYKKSLENKLIKLNNGFVNEIAQLIFMLMM